MFESALQAELAPRVLRFLRTTTWRCSAFEYRMLATGAMSFCLNESLRPLTGERYRPTMTRGHLLTAPDASSWEAIRLALTQP